MATNDPFDVLSHEDRRNAVYAMKESDQNQFTYDDLTEEMVDQGYLDEQEADSFDVELHHQHAPKLDDHGVVNHEGHTLEYRGDEQVEQLLDTPLVD